MVSVTSLPDNITFEADAGETLLEAALRSGVPVAHACGGRAKCSTCRIWILDGLDGAPDRSEAEREMAGRLAFGEEVRLACQLRPAEPLRVRRLVLDETDLVIASQLDRSVATQVGEAKNVTIFFSDIADFTEFSENLSPYDVMYLLNRYFAQVGEIIERNEGYIDKFIGDGLMAIFGIEGQQDASIRAVNAARQCLAAVDRMKPFFAAMYDIDFDIRIGLHYGEAVIGSLGSVGHERLTAIGDVVNRASRVQDANKDAGTRLLISEALRTQVADMVEIADFVRTRLRGTGERVTLHEVVGLKPEVEAELNAREVRDTMQFAGRNWVRVFGQEEIAIGERRILEFEDRDVVVTHRANAYFAFNNACPHLKLPFYERRGAQTLFTGELIPTDSTITEDLGIVCRWHESCFDLQTGDIRTWCSRLNEDGTAPNFEFAGDISKNREGLALYACRIHEGGIWISFD